MSETAGVDPVQGSESSRHLRGEGCSRERRRNQKNYRYVESPCLPCGRAGNSYRKGKNTVVFSALCGPVTAAGEMVLLDRSWYNRAGVEHVMGFCSESEYMEFLHSCPEFERMLVRSGIILVKYWFSVSDEEQERRFQERMADGTKRWKLSPMDLESRSRWVEYSRAKDEMFAHTDTKQVPWYVVNADNKKCARLNVIRHLLSLIPYEDTNAKAHEATTT